HPLLLSSSKTFHLSDECLPLSFTNHTMAVKDFKTRIKIKADAEDVYAAFTNPFTIELWSGYPAVMPEVAGEEFSMWEGDIAGKILEIEPGQRIVQEWYFGEQEEDRKSTRLNSSHVKISYAVFCLKKKNDTTSKPH